MLVFSEAIIERDQVSGGLLHIQQAVVLHLHSSDSSVIFAVVLELLADLMCDFDHKFVV